MRRIVIQMRPFSCALDELIKKNVLSQKTFDAFERQLIETPEMGRVIQGCGGIRKARLGSIGKGKRDSFRGIYFDHPSCEKIYLIDVYEKSVQEDLAQEEKKELKRLVEILKKEAKYG